MNNIKNYWTLPRHTSDWGNIDELVSLIKSKKYHPLNPENKRKMWMDLHSQKKASARNKKFKADSITHRFESLEFFMLGYQKIVNNNKSFLFSPLGELFFKYANDDQKRAKIFLTCLWSIQLKHPKHIFKETNEDFAIYPFRLFYKLLNEQKLGFKIFLPEYCYVISKLNIINSELYDQLIIDILKFRNFSYEKQFSLIKNDEYNVVESLYSFGYYYAKMFNTIKVLDVEEGAQLGRLSHKPKKEGTKVTQRILRNNKYTIPNFLKGFIEKLEKNHLYSEEIHNFNLEKELSSDIQVKLYNFLPKILIDELPDEKNIYSKTNYLLDLPKMLKKYSLNPDLIGSLAWEEFEIKLADAFNSFSDISARWVGGAGNTDIECLYEKIHEKFNVDAKATRSKLQSVNAKRLELHRKKTSAKYTILITPDYSPGALKDITDESVSILKIDPFSQYLFKHYNNLQNLDEMSFNEIRNIVTKNLGKDISQDISDLTFKKFGLQI